MRRGSEEYLKGKLGGKLLAFGYQLLAGGEGAGIFRRSASVTSTWVGVNAPHNVHDDRCGVVQDFELDAKRTDKPDANRIVAGLAKFERFR
jgi:hypothetical protein